MDYNNIKLGLIGQFKVWKARREAEKDRAWRDNIEGEISEVDYSEVERLKTDLLQQKRIKKASKDAAKLYKRAYGKNNDGIGEADFIEEYLIQNGLKEKALPEPEISKKHNFMDQYSTEKSEQEIAYENATREKKMYYEIDGVKYELPYMFSHIYFEQMKSGDFKSNNFPPLTTNDEVNYIINPEKMTPENKYTMLKRMIDMSLSQISEETYMIAQAKPETELKESLPRLTRQASYNDYAVKKIYSEGKVEEANSKLEKMAKKIFEFYKEMSKDEQEETR